MSQRRLKPKAAPFDEVNPGTESGWIWDRHRSGGGGAPLKDVTGTPITNLRTIVRGSGEKPNRHSYDDELGSPSKNVHYRSSPNDYDYDYDRKDNRFRDHNRGDHRDYDRIRDRDRERDYDRDRLRDDNDFRGRNIDRDYDRDDRAFSREGNRDFSSTNQAISPKKGFGSALKELTDGSTLSERESKARKELEYQQLLKQQIDEKRRKKEEEERRIEEIKQQELEEYLMQYYKGNIPPHLKPSLRRRPPKKYDDDTSSGYNKESIKSNPYNDYDDDRSRDMDYKRSPNKRDKDINYPSNARKHEMPNLSLSSQREIPGLERNVERERPYDKRRDKEYDSDRDRDRDRDRDQRNVGGKWVSQTEYDELSALCENLLFQQKDLQNELKQQADIIKGLQHKGPINSSKTPIRSSSGKRGTNIDDANKKIGPTRSKSAIQPRKTTDTYSEATKTPRGKVAFGSSSSSSSNYVEPPKSSRSNAAPTSGILKKNNSDKREVASKIPQGIPRNRSGSADRNLREQRGGGLQGFAKLQAKISDGPMVVTHESDEFDTRSNVRNTKLKKAQSFGGSPTMRSTELNSDSEYLKIGGEEVDVISSDQLDRLLIQARKVRVGR